jgi:uncharacterized membrane protein
MLSALPNFMRTKFYKLSFFFLTKKKNVAITKKKMTDSQTLISADIGVVAVHILISFIFFLASMSNLGTGKEADKERKLFVITSGIFWLVSLLACITILVLLTYIQPKSETTPCPIQLSEPGDSDRSDIENFLNDLLNEKYQNVKPFDSSLTYLVVTGFYKNRLIYTAESFKTPHSTLAPDTTIPPKAKDLISIVEKYSHIPIGFLKDNQITTLTGMPLFEV